jgi:hypothetical protein
MNRDNPLPIKCPVIGIEHARRIRDETEIERSISAHISQYERWHSEQKTMLPQALKALVRLLETALQGNDDTHHICRRFLLGLQEGRKQLFDMSTLRRLNIGYWLDCMAVLGLYQYTTLPIHQLIENGELLWSRLGLIESSEPLWDRLQN